MSRTSPNLSEKNGLWIKEQRRIMGNMLGMRFSQAMLANLLGVTPALVCKYEKTNSPIPRHYYLAICYIMLDVQCKCGFKEVIEKRVIYT
jgi:hypothetical protein